MCHEEKLHVSTLNSSEMDFINHQYDFELIKSSAIKKNLTCTIVQYILYEKNSTAVII